MSLHVAFTYIEAFKNIIGFKDLIEDTISYNKATNSVFSTADIIDFMVDAVIQGYSRFSHMESLREDQIYTNFFQRKAGNYR